MNNYLTTYNKHHNDIVPECVYHLFWCRAKEYCLHLLQYTKTPVYCCTPIDKVVSKPSPPITLAQAE